MITKNKLKKDFSIIPNAIIEDTTISPEARLMYIYICTKRDDWDVIHADIQRVLNVDSRTTMAKIPRELEQAGWVTREKLPKGTYNYILNSSKKLPVACPKIEQHSPEIGRPKNELQCPNNGQVCPNNEQDPCPNFSTCQKMDTNKDGLKIIYEEDKSNNTSLNAWGIWQSYLALTQHQFTPEELESIRDWVEFKHVVEPAQINATIRNLKRFKLNGANICHAIDQSIAGNYNGIIDLSPKQFTQPHKPKSSGHNCNSKTFAEPL